MTWWQLILFPFSILIDGITQFRNFLYDRGVLKAFTFETNLIAIGNLSMGGSGKSPFTIYLIDFLRKSGFPITTLSRGYRRKTSGFRLASASDSAATLGDEPYQYFLRYGAEVGVSVGEDRVLSIPDILFYRPQTEVILLDDAFQQRAIAFNFSILLTRYDVPFYEDWVIPSGTLRERRANAARADVVIMSNCPKNLSLKDQIHISGKVKHYVDVPVFFTQVVYLPPVPFFGKDMKKKVIGISGIANAVPFESYLKECYKVKLTHRYPDHHNYTLEDIKAILSEMDEDTALITTEKDYVKLIPFDALKDFSCFYIPIEIQFLKDEALFQSMLVDRIKNYQSEIN